MPTRLAYCRTLLPVLLLSTASAAAAGSYDVELVVQAGVTILPGGGYLSGGLGSADGTTGAGEILVAGSVWDGVDLNYKVFLLGGSGLGDRVVIEAGEPTPGGGAWSDFDPTVNAIGDFAFSGGVDFASFGSWKRTGSGDAEIAIPGDPAPVPGGTWADNLEMESISDGGVTLFYAEVAIAGGTTAGWFLDGPGGQQTAVLDGDAAPGGGTFANNKWYSAAQIDDESFVFVADVTGGTTTNGLYRWDSGVITPLVVAGDAAPAPGGGTIDKVVSWPDANHGGVAVFMAEVFREGPYAYPALFIHDGTTLTEIFYFLDPVPGFPGSQFSSPSLPAINDLGQVAWSGQLVDAPWTGLFFWDGETIEAVLMEGIPHIPSGLDVYQFGQRVELEDNGRILFDAGSNDLGGYGLFTATPISSVPALSNGGAALLALALVGTAIRSVRSGRS